MRILPLPLLSALVFVSIPALAQSTGDTGFGGGQAQVIAAVTSLPKENTEINYSPITTPSTPDGDINTFYGAGAGINVTHGRAIVAVGYGALSAFQSTSAWISGPENGLFVAIGADALANLTDGIDTVAIGEQSMSSTTASTTCTSVGTHAGSTVSTCLNSTVIGGHALGQGGSASQTTNDTLVGNDIMGGNTAKDDNAMVGSFIAAAGVGDHNSIVGSLAAVNATNISQNTIIGASTAGGLLGGNNNNILGYHAGPITGDFSDSILIGSYAGSSLASLSGTTAIGQDVLSGTPGGTPTNATIIGYHAVSSGTFTGSRVSILGSFTGLHLSTATDDTLFGHFTGANLSSGSNNTILGSQAGEQITTGGQNVLVGTGAGYLSNGNDSNDIAVGAFASAAQGVSGATQIGTGTNAVSNSFQVNNTQILDGNSDLHATIGTPSDNSTCTAGAIRVDSNFIYVCTGASLWKRAALSAF